MSAVFAALIPVFIIIALAAVLHRTGFLAESAWEGMERATYFVFFPAFLFRSLAEANFAGFTVWPLAYALLSGILTMALILPLLRPLLRLDGAAYSSVYQGAIRWNSFVALATLQGLYGTTGTTLAAVAFAVIIPVVNALSVYVLARHAGPGARASMIAKAVLRNPLVLSCILGLGWHATGLGLPQLVDAALRPLSETSIALGLFTVGAGLDFGHLRARPAVMVATTVLKLALMPMLMFLFCYIYNVQGPARGVAIVAGAVPTATNAYILARQLGGDARLMAGLVSLTTLAAFVTMPLALWLMT